MLRDLPAHTPALEEGEMFMIAPGAFEEPSSRSPIVSALDDVFGSAGPSPVLSGLDDEDDHLRPTATTVSPLVVHATDPSDIPRLRATHVTNGYRDGIAANKEASLQRGFDDGFAVGTALGLRAGWCLGALEGAIGAARRGDAVRAGGLLDAGPPSGQQLATDLVDEFQRLLATAIVELDVSRLFGEDFFGVEGEARYAVPGEADRGQSHFALQVADAHPMVRKWINIATEATHTLGLTLE